MSKTRKILFVVLLVVAAFGVGYGVFHIASQNSAASIYDQLQQQVVTPVRDTKPADEPQTETQDSEDPGGEDEIPPDPREPKQPPEKEAYVSPIDFDALWDINSDIFAWIDIPETNIHFPIVQHPTENNYYLVHTIEGYHARVPGSIYTFTGVAKDFSDFNTIIYGHNMYNGTMFSDLYMFQDRDYLAEHPSIHIYTPDTEYTYQIFGAVVYDDRLISASYDFSWDIDRTAYLDSLNNSNSGTLYLDEIPVSEKSHIITLSTCIRYHEDQRLLIVAVRDEPEDAARQTGLLDRR